MQIQNNFVELIKQKKKTFEIRKEKSIHEYLGGISFGSTLSNIKMEIIDKGNHKNCNLGIFTQGFGDIIESTCECEKDFKLVFDGYHRIKVNDLIKWYEINESFSYITACEGIDYESWLKGAPDWFIKNSGWLWDYKDWILEYLKDEEYCIIYFINIEETFKVNGWEWNNGKS